MPAPEEQQAWREHTAGSITVHLTDLHIGVLDLIARELYAADLHKPPGRISAVNPSRPAAIRELLEQWIEEHGGAAAVRRRVRRLPSRTELATFWRAETSWRRTRREPTADGPFAPTPPWR